MFRLSLEFLYSKLIIKLLTFIALQHAFNIKKVAIIKFSSFVYVVIWINSVIIQTFCIKYPCWMLPRPIINIFISQIEVSHTRT